MIKITLEDKREIDANLFAFVVGEDFETEKSIGKPERKSLEEKCEFPLFDSMITPKSSLFLRPNESPQYAALNKRLIEINSQFEQEIDLPCIGKNQHKIVSVRNTMCSSLMLRRNKSEKQLRLGCD